jgi:hydroxymethylbilane synthase
MVSETFHRSLPAETARHPPAAIDGEPIVTRTETSAIDRSKDEPYILCMGETNRIVVGTRGSLLARSQTDWVVNHLRETRADLKVEIRIIKTSGDQSPDTPLHEIGGKGVFIKEIEEALLDSTIDLAVHSAKDLPTEMTEGLAIGATPVREDPRDALISAKADRIEDLPESASVGTSSLRRQAQLLSLRPDLRFSPLRGNIDTRIDKVLLRGEHDATVLAVAGLRRAGLNRHASRILSIEQMIPACGQGVLALQIRQDDEYVLDLIASIHDEAAAEELRCEREILGQLEAGCQAPIGVHAQVDASNLSATAIVALPDGSETIRAKHQSGVGGWRSLADRVVDSLRSDGADEILSKCR